MNPLIIQLHGLITALELSGCWSTANLFRQQLIALLEAERKKL